MISLIAAIASENRALGKDNKLIYQISDDLKRFRKLTSGHPIIMGRKTYESIGHPLPNRTNIIITRDEDYKVEEAITAHSLEEAIKTAKTVIARSKATRQSQKDRHASLAMTSGEIFVIGGGQIYQEAIGLADKLYLTIVEGNPNADTFFPDYSAFTKIVSKEEHESDGHKYSFVDLER